MEAGTREVLCVREGGQGRLMVGSAKGDAAAGVADPSSQPADSLPPVPAVERLARRALTSALQYLSLAAGFVLISMASALRFNQVRQGGGTCIRGRATQAKDWVRIGALFLPLQAAITGVDRRRCSDECVYTVRSGNRSGLRARFHLL